VVFLLFKQRLIISTRPRNSSVTFPIFVWHGTWLNCSKDADLSCSVAGKLPLLRATLLSLPLAASSLCC
jgi:hypothetical protein